MTKRKLYWLLIFPSVIIAMIIIYFMPEDLPLEPKYIALKATVVAIPAIFWIIYYSVIKIFKIES